jgi:hypothetical protein
VSDPHGVWVPLLAKTARNGAPSFVMAQGKLKSSDKSVPSTWLRAGRPTRSVVPTSRKSGEKWGTLVRGGSGEIKIVGQECPFDLAQGRPTQTVRGSHFSQKQREMGHPSTRKITKSQRRRTGSAVKQGRRGRPFLHSFEIGLRMLNRGIDPLMLATPRLASGYQMLTFGDESNWPTARYA